MIKKKKTGKKLLSFLLTLSMVMSLMSGMCLTALASDDEKTYRDFLNTTTVVKFDGKEWYLTKQSPDLEDKGLVTLLSKEIVGSTMFCAEEVYTNNIYEGSAVQRAVNEFYNEKISAEAKEASSVFILSKEQAKEIEVANSNVLKCQKYNNREDSWWLCSPGMNWARAACVFGSSGHVSEDGAWVKSEWENLGVRPSLWLNLSKVNFSYVELTGAENMSPSGGETTQAFFSLKSSGSSQKTMTDVVYTAKDGYYFPEGYSVSPVNGITVTRISDNQIKVSGTLTGDVAKITLTAPTAMGQPAAPTGVTATDCTKPNVNDGRLDGVTDDMEYKKSDAEAWIAVTGSAITGLAPGTYYVRTKKTDTTLPSLYQELVVKGFVEYTVLFRVLYGAWDDGSTEDKTVTLTGREGGNLKLTAEQIPKVGNKPNENYMAGIWLVTPSTDTPITDWTSYVYLYLPSEMAVVADDPTPNTLNYTGFAQNLVTAGSVSGGTMMYALGTETEATEPYTTSIPKATEVGTYYVWYGVKGDESHIDTAPKCIQVTIGERKPIPTPTPTPTPDPEPTPDPDPEPEPEPTPAPEPQDPDEYTDPDSGEVIPELVEVPETDEAGTVIEKQSDGSVTVTSLVQQVRLVLQYLQKDRYIDYTILIRESISIPRILKNEMHFRLWAGTTNQSRQPRR